QDGHDDLGGRSLLGRVLAHRDAAPVVLDGHGTIEVDLHVDAVAVTGQRLVDRVVHHLVHHVVQTGAVVGVPDVHAGALANSLPRLTWSSSLATSSSRSSGGSPSASPSSESSASLSASTSERSWPCEPWSRAMCPPSSSSRSSVWGPKPVNPRRRSRSRRVTRPSSRTARSPASSATASTVAWLRY